MGFLTSAQKDTRKLKLFFCLLALFPCVFSFADVSPFGREEPNLIVHNRILARVGSKTISVIDVMKKMDIYMSRAYPEAASSTAARYQFFSNSWRAVLEQMIDNELMLLDAQQIELKVSDGDIRETLQEKFGPNVMNTLDKLGMTYQEAWDMIHTELVVQRMTWYRIHSKAVQSVNPQDIKAAYREFCQAHPPEEKWVYQVCSIRPVTQQIGEAIAEKAYALLHDQKVPFTSLETVLKTEEEPAPSFTLTLSPDYVVDEKQLSQSHKEVLQQLQPGTYSKPIAQKSRLDGSVAIRIFYLKEHTKNDPHSFDKLSDKLHDELVDLAVEKESSLYITKLRERYGFNKKTLGDLVPSDFQPFSLP